MDYLATGVAITTKPETADAAPLATRTLCPHVLQRLNFS